MSVKCILQGQDDKNSRLYIANKDNQSSRSDYKVDWCAANENEVMKYVPGPPEVPITPIAADEYIPYSWEEINAIALSGHAQDWISVGALKSETLTEEVLGTTTHDIRVIGINEDNDESITFQTKNCLVNGIEFGSFALWSNSTARTQCQNYYNAFLGKGYIMTVSKGTATNYSSQSNTATQ